MGFLDAFKAVFGVANRLLGGWFIMATLVQPSWSLRGTKATTSGALPPRRTIDALQRFRLIIPPMALEVSAFPSIQVAFS
jgi:hypothetical protein